MSFISHARNFEDVMLWRALRHVDKGFYIDAGAGGPAAVSATAAFYERGWHGVNLEPSRDRHASLRVARPADINLQLVAGADAGLVTFYDGADATLDEARARQLADGGAAIVQRQLERQTLSAVCAAHAAPDIHFMKIDMAGCAPDVLAGLDLSRFRPWVLVVAHGIAQAAVAAARYERVYDDGLNTFYVAAEHPELRAAFAVPPNAADDFVLRQDHDYAWPLTEWRERVANLKAAAAAADNRAGEAREWAEARVREYKEKASAAEAQTAARERELADMSARASAAEQLAQERADYYESVIQAIYQSSSWRITRPLRSINFRLKAMRAKLRGMGGRMRARLARMRAGLAGLVKGAVRRVMRAIMSRPAVSFFVRSQIGRHPRLTNWLRVAVQRTQATPPAVAVDSPADLQHLPSAARQVLADLQRTMNSTRQQ